MAETAASYPLFPDLVPRVQFALALLSVVKHQNILGKTCIH